MPVLARSNEAATRLRVDIIETASLGDRSYVVSDGSVALVIDPQRDVDRVLSLAETLGVRITHVLETHLHNDYISGGLQLARGTGATYVVPGTAVVDFQCRAAFDGDVIEGGALRVTVLHTPGHTPHHVSYALACDDQVAGVFTGGSMLFGSAGRTDLFGCEQTLALTRDQFHSVRRLARELPSAAKVYPTHGFGSFCSSAPITADGSTVGEQLVLNPALTLDEPTYVQWLLAGLVPYPAYYAHMSTINAAGPQPWSPVVPELVDARELRRRVEAGGWVVDLRHRRAFAAGHLAGTVGFELADGFATYVGWLLPWGEPLTLLGDSRDQIASAQCALARIGVDRPAGAAVVNGALSPGGAGVASFHVADFAALASALSERADRVGVLDTRRTDERAAGYVTGSQHIPVHELVGRLEEVAHGQVWVYCASGYRASIAASLLDRRGRDVVLVDDSFESAAGAGVPVTIP